MRDSVKLPLFMAVPVILGLCFAVYFLLPPDTPAPPTSEPLPLDNSPAALPPDNEPSPLPVDVDTGPPTRTGFQSPRDPEVAAAMSEEAWLALGEIRSRLELKYKYADYVLDRNLTLDSVMRRPDRLKGNYFRPDDYELRFPAGDADLASIECRRVQGDELPDGPLRMVVDLRTGETKQEGSILARDAAGRVLLGADEYTVLWELMRSAILTHFRQQQNMENELSKGSVLPDEMPNPFTAEDLSFKPDGDLRYILGCETLRGIPLAQPIRVVGDYSANTLSVTHVDSPEWNPLPTDRTEFEDRVEGLLEDIHRMVRIHLSAERKPEELRVYMLGGSWWYYRWAGITPFDVKIDVSSEDPRKITLRVATAFGRALPFEPVQYIAEAEPDANGE